MSGWIILFVLCGAGVPAFIKGLAELRHRAEARKRMRAALQSLDDHAVVTLRGKVRALGNQLEAPLSGTACVAHRSSVRIYGGRRKSAVGPRRALDDESLCEMVSFALVTADGELIVDGANPELAIRPHPVIPRRLEREAAFLRRIGIDDDPAEAGFDEIVITDGMKVTVHGVARLEVTPSSSEETNYRDAPRRMRITGDDAHPLTISER